MLSRTNSFPRFSIALVFRCVQADEFFHVFFQLLCSARVQSLNIFSVRLLASFCLKSEKIFFSLIISPSVLFMYFSSGNCLYIYLLKKYFQCDKNQHSLPPGLDLHVQPSIEYVGRWTRDRTPPGDDSYLAGSLAQFLAQ